MKLQNNITHKLTRVCNLTLELSNNSSILVSNRGQINRRLYWQMSKYLHIYLCNKLYQRLHRPLKYRLKYILKNTI